MDIGGELRTARQTRSLSLDDIAHTTKISPRVLRAIENNAFDTVPRGPFMRGYLMAYARNVGLDGDDLVRRYRSEYNPPEPPPPGGSAILAADGMFDPVYMSIVSSRSEMLQIGAIVVVVIAVMYLGSQRQPNPATVVDAPAAESVRAAATAASRAAKPTPAPVAVATDTPVGTSGNGVAKIGPLTIAFRADGPCWVEATADGERVLTRLLAAGDQHTIAVKDGLALRVGDPATFTFTINGAAGRSLGRAGRAVTIRIDPGNYQQFLAP